jgi:hypothetical protein
VIGFLQPLVLVGLVLGAIPPLLHLLGRRRPPTVVFPAVQYLTATEREHSRRLKLRNLVLMVLRIAVIVLLVMAAARPVIRVGGGSSHPPTAVAIVLDNSLSSSAVVAGQRTLDRLKEQARVVLEQATEDDRLWLVLADGIPQRVSRGEALALVDSVGDWPVRGDLGEAGRLAASVVREAGLPHAEVVVLSDIQASALSSGDAPDVAVLVLEPPPAPRNLGIDSAIADPLIWSPSGTVAASLGGVGESPRAVQLLLGDRAVARAVGAAGDQIVLAGRGVGGGWTRAAVELDPDELRADDRWWLSVRLGSPASVRVEPGAGRFVEAAVRVLIQGGLAEDGGHVTVTDRLFTGVTVLLPPADRSLVGATNRALESRGLGTRFGDLLEGEWSLAGEVGPIAGTAVYRRYQLRGDASVLASVAGEPWLVRERDVIVVASRLEDTWTALPVSAAFVPFLDFLLNRAAAEQMWIVRSAPGTTVSLPSPVTTIALRSGPVPVPADRHIVSPMATGVYFLSSEAGDTVGALEVNHDLRESRLAPATRTQLRAALGSRATILDERTLERELFGGARRADLASAFLVAALLAALAELGVASFLGARRIE